MRRAILHIGMPRTGTTTFQRILTSLRPDLARAGVLYPELKPRSAPEPHLSHQHLGEALDGRRPPEERAELLAQLEGQLAATEAEVVLLSYEALCLIPRGLGPARVLAPLFERHGFTPEVLVTVKPQGELLNSSYTWRTQFLREHRTFGRFFQAQNGHWTGDYGRLFAPWRQACGGRLRAVPVRDARADTPLVARILTELELNHVAPLFSAANLALVDNRSPGPVAVEVARRLRFGGAHLRLGSMRREVTRFVEAAALRRGLDTVPFKGLDPGLREQDAIRWRDSNDRFAQEVWAVPWAARVAGERPEPVNEIARGAPDSALRSAVDAILGETCDAFLIRLGARPMVALRTICGDAVAGLSRQLRMLRAWRPGPA